MRMSLDQVLYLAESGTYQMTWKGTGSTRVWMNSCRSAQVWELRESFVNLGVDESLDRRLTMATVFLNASTYMGLRFRCKATVNTSKTIIPPAKDPDSIERV